MSEGPIWTTVTNGINLLGKCRNKSCEAYKKLVVCQIGFMEYLDLIEDYEKITCPICK